MMGQSQSLLRRKGLNQWVNFTTIRTIKPVVQMMRKVIAAKGRERKNGSVIKRKEGQRKGASHLNTK